MKSGGPSPFTSERKTSRKEYNFSLLNSSDLAVFTALINKIQIPQVPHFKSSFSRWGRALTSSRSPSFHDCIPDSQPSFGDTARRVDFEAFSKNTQAQISGRPPSSSDGRGVEGSGGGLCRRGNSRKTIINNYYCLVTPNRRRCASEPPL